MLRMERRRRLGLVLVERAEAAGEGDLLGGRQILPREDQHDVLQPGLVDLALLQLGERLAEIDARDLCAGGEAQRRDRDRAHPRFPLSKLFSRRGY